MYSFALVMWEVLSVQTPPFPGCAGLRVAHEVAYSGLRPAMDGLLPLAEIDALRRTGQTHGLTGRRRGAGAGAGAGAAKTTTQKENEKTTKEGTEETEEQKSGSENQGDRGENQEGSTGHHPRDGISNVDEDRVGDAVNGAVNDHQSSPPPPGWLVVLMQRCWAEEPKHRPSFADICECLQSRSVAGLDRETGGEPPEGYARTLQTLKYGLEAPPGNGGGRRRM